ncbi:MAG: glycoside hydrolase family 2, partial [Alistipes sp.]|nr:glycoside hydrolase family 2 [Alistipes sp.]
GTMNYTTEFTCEDTTGHICLNLGRVESMAKVYVNDQLAGGAWCAPYSIDISQYVQQGKNSLRIEVVNKWVNRIVGDLQLPTQERKISLTANPYNAQSAIPSSGLIGPVVLEQIK